MTSTHTLSATDGSNEPPPFDISLPVRILATKISAREEGFRGALGCSAIRLLAVGGAMLVRWPRIFEREVDMTCVVFHGSEADRWSI